MTLPLTTASAEAPTRRSPVHELARFGPTATVVVALAAVWLMLGTSPADVAGYGARVIFGVLLPGVVIWRLVSERIGPLMDDAVFGFSIGTIAQLPVWWLCVAMGLSFWWWPGLLLGGVLALGPARRRVFRSSSARTPIRWAWATAGVCLLALAWVTGDFLRWNPADPGAGHVYYRDMLYQLGLAAEASNHMPPTDPFVAGEPLFYHWLAHMDMAAASGAAGVELATVLFQLWVPVVVLAGVCTVAVVASRLSSHLWAGPLAALFVFGVGQVSARDWTANQFQPMTFFYYWASPTQALATVLTVTAAYIACRYLESTSSAAARTFWWIGLPLLASLTLVKASALPLIVAGAAATWGMAILRPAIASRRRAGTVTALGLGMLLAAAFLLYGGENQGLHFEQPLDTFVTITRNLVPAILAPDVSSWATGLSVAIIVATWTVAVLGRLAGVVLLLPRWRTLTAPQIFLFGALLAGVLAYATLTHPGGSNIYFAIGAFPLGAVLSAWGLCATAPVLTRRAVMALGGCVAVTGGLVFAARGILGGDQEIGERIRQQLVSATRPHLILGGVALLLMIALWLQHRRHRLGGVRAAHVLVAGVIAAGLPMTISYVISEPVTSGTSKARALLGASSEEAVTAEGVDAARWLRDHSDPDDVVATNRHCPTHEEPAGSPTGDCRAMSFWVSAYTERRSLVEAWAFSLEARPRDVEAGTAPGVQPFWDPAKLADNDRLFMRADAASATRLCERGVDWAFLDRRWAPDAPSLDNVATLRYRTPDAEVYELRC